MSYLALARKYRPQNFADLVGQAHVVQTLSYALDNQRLHHAYLFTGTRGVGKTTLARILAKSMLCENNGISSNPCGECQNCVDISQNTCIDLVEIDAASRTKVEDTRELLENVRYAPNRARFKVYIIDEVHMLTGHSFNALLKTLEEPPEHVKILFATTDPQKIPPTILSRCLQFSLKRLTVEEIDQHLQQVLQKESITFEAEATQMIAKAGDGSMRDSLSVLDQAIAYAHSNVNAESVSAMLGLVNQTPLLACLTEVVNGDAEKLFSAIEALTNSSVDFVLMADELIALFHQMAVAKLTGQGLDEDIQKVANALTDTDIQLYYQMAVQGRKDLHYLSDKRAAFEMLLMRLMAFRPATSLTIGAESTAALSQQQAAEKKRIKP